MDAVLGSLATLEFDAVWGCYRASRSTAPPGRERGDDVKADRTRRPSRQPMVKSQAEIERERARRQEQEDLAYYGYRHYTRDRNQWLQTLPPEEQAAEVKRDRDRRKYGGSAARHHKQILHAGNLPADTSPADPRYVQIKRKIESSRDRRQRIIAIAAITAMLALIWIAIADGAYWFVAILAISAVVGLRTAYALYKPPVKQNGPNRLSPATNSEMMARHTPSAQQGRGSAGVVKAWCSAQCKAMGRTSPARSRARTGSAALRSAGRGYASAVELVVLVLAMVCGLAGAWFGRSERARIVSLAGVVHVNEEHGAMSLLLGLGWRYERRCARP
jgi:hypothetical protein